MADRRATQKQNEYQGWEFSKSLKGETRDKRIIFWCGGGVRWLIPHKNIYLVPRHASTAIPRGIGTKLHIIKFNTFKKTGYIIISIYPAGMNFLYYFDSRLDYM